MLLRGELLQELFVRRVLGLLLARKLVLQVVLLREELPDLTPVMAWHTFGGGAGGRVEGQRDLMHRIQLNNEKELCCSPSI